MNKFYASITVAALMAGAGCSNEMPRPTLQGLVDDRNNQAVTPTAPIASESSRIALVPPARPDEAPTKIAKKPKARKKQTISKFAGNLTNSSYVPLTTAEQNEQRVSGIAKVVDECPESLHGHAPYLRSDIAYSVTGLDCQGDRPGQAFLFK